MTGSLVSWVFGFGCGYAVALGAFWFVTRVEREDAAARKRDAKLIRDSMRARSRRPGGGAR